MVEVEQFEQFQQFSQFAQFDDGKVEPAVLPARGQLSALPVGDRRSSELSLGSQPPDVHRLLPCEVFCAERDLGVVLEKDALVADLVHGHHHHVQVLHQRLLLELLLQDHVEAVEEDIEGGHEQQLVLVGGAHHIEEKVDAGLVEDCQSVQHDDLACLFGYTDDQTIASRKSDSVLIVGFQLLH